MDPVSMIVGAVILLLGGVLGRITKRRERPSTAAEPDTICGCEHELAMHDPQTNQCHETEYERQWSKKEQTYVSLEVRCKCRQYTGARPIEQFYTPRSLP